jgi:hypothetical protein
VEAGDHKKGITLAGDGEYDIYAVLFKDGKVSEPVKINTVKDIDPGPGRFVGVIINNNRAVWSADGITWEEATLPSNASWRDVAYGNGRFVAIAQNSDKAVWSEDGGATWKAATMPSASSWSGVAYGNGMFVAVAVENKAAWSANGVTWEEVTMPSAGWYGIAYGNGRFVATGINKAAWSADGVTWEEVVMPSAGGNIAYGNGRFVTLSGNGTKVIWSEEGIIWTEVTLPKPSDYWHLITITYGNGKFVGVGELIVSRLGTETRYCSLGSSVNGVDWTTQFVDRIGGYITHGNGKFVVVGDSVLSGSSFNKTSWSADGVTWTTVTTTFDTSGWKAITYGER